MDSRETLLLPYSRWYKNKESNLCFSGERIKSFLLPQGAPQKQNYHPGLCTRQNKVCVLQKDDVNDGDDVNTKLLLSASHVLGSVHSNSQVRN